MNTPTKEHRAMAAQSRSTRHDIDTLLDRAPNLSAERKETLRRRLVNVPLAWRIRHLDASAGQSSPQDAIKVFCAECMGFETGGPQLCTSLACPLYTRRTG